MAGAGYKLFNTGDVLTAQQVNEYLQQQVTMVFANATARTSALSGVLAEGMMSYLQDTNLVEVYDGSNWVSVGNTGDITGVTAGTGISGGGTSGTVTITNSMATAIDAKGDLIVGTGADTFDRLAVGTNGHTLVADSSTATGLKWAAVASTPSFVGCSLFNTSQQSIGNLLWVAATWTSETFDTDNFHNNSTNTSRITIPSGKGGKYLVTAGVTWDTAATGYQTAVAIYKNNTSVYDVRQLSSTTEINSYQQLTRIMDLAANDYLEVYVLHYEGGTKLITKSESKAQFQVQYLGA